LTLLGSPRGAKEESGVGALGGAKGKAPQNTSPLAAVIFVEAHQALDWEWMHSFTLKNEEHFLALVCMQHHCWVSSACCEGLLRIFNWNDWCDQFVSRSHTESMTGARRKTNPQTKMLIVVNCWVFGKIIYSWMNILLCCC